MLSYDQFKTGLTFTDVRRQLACAQIAARATGDVKHVRRNGVLGYWHSLKKDMYQYYVSETQRSNGAELHTD